ncbi:MAG: 2'-5' RNA ligase family protein [Dehalococcoidales bacterium]|jgi:2'-5' RNA ligase
MGETKDAYAVALIFNGEVEKALAGLHRDFQQYVTYTLVPHITLVYPFTPAGGIESVIHRLDDIGKSHRPFRLTLEGIKYFETVNNVAYVAVKEQEALKAFVDTIVKSIRGVITGYYAEKDYDPAHYIPHLTIGEKIPHDVFPEVKKRFADYPISHECEITRFTLAGEADGQWETLKVFRLEG